MPHQVAGMLDPDSFSDGLCDVVLQVRQETVIIIYYSIIVYIIL